MIAAAEALPFTTSEMATWNWINGSTPSAITGGKLHITDSREFVWARNLDAFSHDGCVGFRWYTTEVALPSDTDHWLVRHVRNSSTSTDFAIGLKVLANGTFEVWWLLPGAEHVLGSSSAGLAQAGGVVHHIALYCDMVGTGPWELRVNNVTIASGSRPAGTNYTVAGPTFGSNRVGSVVTYNDYFYDFYSTHADSPPFDELFFSNNYIVGVLRPNGAGSFSDLTPVGDTPNWKCVDEVTHDDDTTYVKVNNSTTHQHDTYAFSNLPSATMRPYLIEFRAWATSGEVGATYKPNFKFLSGAFALTFDSAFAFSSPSNTYTRWPTVQQFLALGSTPLTAADVNVMEFGFGGARFSGTYTNGIKITQVYCAFLQDGAVTPQYGYALIVG